MSDNTNRTVLCKKLNKELPGLTKPPFKGEIGDLIYNNISAEGWLMWKEDMQIKVINEYRLNLADKEHYQQLVDQMLLFLNLKDSGKVVEVGDAQRGGR